MSIETCYDVLTVGSLAVLVLLALVCLVRCILGPRISDRVMAVNMIGTLTGKQGDDFSIICHDLSGIAAYARVDTPTFKLMKRNLPGPFTFLLSASNKVPDKFLDRKKTVGVRIPANGIPLAIVEALGNPLVTASVKTPGPETEYTTDPSLIYERYGDRVDMVVDGGYGNAEPSTIVDCTGDEPEIIREGIGELI